MGCIYEETMTSICSLSINQDGSAAEDMQGATDSFCNVSDDPDPSANCDSYESDYTCLECGIDLNVDECECED